MSENAEMRSVGKVDPGALFHSFEQFQGMGIAVAAGHLLRTAQVSTPAPATIFTTEIWPKRAAV